MWAVYRNAVGIDASDRKRKLTQFEAIMLIVRKNWREISKQVGLPYWRDPDLFRIEAMAEKWVALAASDKWKESISHLVAMDNVKGKNLTVVVETCLGKQISERTIRRRCQAVGMPLFKRKNLYSSRQLMKIVNAVPLSKNCTT